MRGTTLPATALSRLKATSHRAWEPAMAENMENILELARSTPPPESLLDLGCDAGGRTAWIADLVELARCTGSRSRQVVPRSRPREACRWIWRISANLFPTRIGVFDLVVSNQVIEHVVDRDNFVRENYRVLKPGGRAVISTENLARWHNVASLVLGWQPFSLTNVSEAAQAVGNPLGIHRGEEGELRGHLPVFAYRGLRELYALHGFTVERILGAGYYALPGAFARLDPRRAAFLTVAARRPEPPAEAGA